VKESLKRDAGVESHPDTERQGLGFPAAQNPSPLRCWPYSGPLFENREKWGTLVFFSANTKSNVRYTYPPEMGPAPSRNLGESDFSAAGAELRSAQTSEGARPHTYTQHLRGLDSPDHLFPINPFPVDSGAEQGEDQHE
jgi:hypothetical protein